MPEIEMQSSEPGAAPPGTGTPEPASELLAGKYKDTDALVAAYKELEAKLGAPSAPSEPKAPETPVPATTEPLTKVPEPAESTPEVPAGLDMDSLAKEWAENDGKLTEATLAKHNLSPEVVAQYAAGQEALAAIATQKMYEAVGGEQNANAILEWAGPNLSDSEREAVNSQLTSKDVEVRKLAMQALQSRYTQANGSTPLVNGVATGGIAGFQSNAEMQSAMKDPRYAKDPAYRDQVSRKIALMVQQGL